MTDKQNPFEVNLFGTEDIFAPTASPDMFSLPSLSQSQTQAPSAFSLSPASSAVASAQAVQASAFERQQREQQRLFEKRQKDLEIAEKERERAFLKQQRELEREQKERERAEAKAVREQEKAERELKRELAKDPTKLIRQPLNQIFANKAYIQAGDKQKADIIKANAPLVEQALRQAGYDDEVIDISMRAYHARGQADVARYIRDNDERGLGGIVSDVWTSTKKYYHSAKQFFETKDADEAQTLLNKLTANQPLDNKDVIAITNLGLNKHLGGRKLAHLPQGGFGLTAKQRDDLLTALRPVATKEFSDVELQVLKQEELQRQFSPKTQRETKNFAYQSAKKQLENPDTGFTKSFFGTISTAWDEGLMSQMLPSSGSVVPVVITTIASALATGGTSAVLSALGVSANAIRAITTGTQLATATATGATLSTADVVSSARAEMLNMPLEKLRTLPNWQTIVASVGGDEHLARRRLATMASNDKQKEAMLLGMVTSLIGVEGLIAGITSRATVRATTGAVTGGISRAVGVGGAVAGGFVEEAVEEGFNKYLVNRTLNGYNAGVNPMHGVAHSAGIGAISGAGLSGAVASVGAISGHYAPQTPQVDERTQATRQAQQLAHTVLTNPQEIQQALGDGKVDYAYVKRTVGEHLQQLNTNPERQAQDLQAYYDLVIDTPEVKAKLSDYEFSELKYYIETVFDVNTRPFIDTSTPEQSLPYLIYHNDGTEPILEQLKGYMTAVDDEGVVSFTSPNNEADISPLSLALADIVTDMHEQKDKTSVERASHFINSLAVVSDAHNLTDDEQVKLSKIAYEHLKASYERQESQYKFDDPRADIETARDYVTPQYAPDITHLPPRPKGFSEGVERDGESTDEADTEQSVQDDDTTPTRPREATDESGAVTETEDDGQFEQSSPESAETTKSDGSVGTKKTKRSSIPKRSKPISKTQLEPMEVLDALTRDLAHEINKITPRLHGESDNITNHIRRTVWEHTDPSLSGLDILKPLQVPIAKLGANLMNKYGAENAPVVAYLFKQLPTVFTARLKAYIRKKNSRFNLATEDDTQSEAVAEPQVTNEPEAVAEPEVTSEPQVTNEPEVVNEPQVTSEPEASPTKSQTQDHLPTQGVTVSNKRVLIKVKQGKARKRGKLKNKQAKWVVRHQASEILQEATVELTPEQLAQVDRLVADLERTGNFNNRQELDEHIIAESMFANFVPDISDRVSVPKQPSILKTLYNSLTKFFKRANILIATVSLAIAGYLAEPVSVRAEANVAPHEAVNHYIQTNRDTQGKPYIIADKTKGELYLYTGDGVLQTTTPALFGKEIGDTTGKVTPAGKYPLTYSTVETEGYGGTAQVMGEVSDPNNVLAIHRVYTKYPSEKRQARLDSKTADDNRISHGCINVPNDFFNQYLDKPFDGYIYVIPETAEYTGNRYGTALPTASDTPTRATVSAMPATDTQDTLEREVDAGVRLLSYTPEGTTPSGQLGITFPTQIDGATYDLLNLPQGEVTPAQQSLEPVFDTLPTDVEADGITLPMLATLLAGGLAVRSGRRVLKSTKNRYKQQAGEATVDVPHNTLPPSDTPIIDEDGYNHVLAMRADSRAKWFKYLQDVGYTKADYDADFQNLQFQVYQALSDTTQQEILSDNFKKHNTWQGETVLGGLFSKYMNFAGGATIRFDRYMDKLGVPRVGVESDSNYVSVALKKATPVSNAMFGNFMHRYITPLDEKMQYYAVQHGVSEQEISEDIGNYATNQHIIQEGHAHFLYEKEQDVQSLIYQIAELTVQQTEVKHWLDTYSEAKDSSSYKYQSKRYGEFVKKIELLEQKKTELLEIIEKTRNYYLTGDKDTYPDVRLVGGRTLPYMQAQNERIVAKYGQEVVDELQKLITDVIKGIHTEAGTFGVYSKDQLASHKRINFKHYVPLYRVPRDPTDIDTSQDDVSSTWFDDLFRQFTEREVRSMGLSKDISLYHREGALNPSDHAYNNLRVYARSVANLIGQVDFRNSIRMLFENDWGRGRDESLDGERTSPHIPDLMRFSLSMPKHFLPSEFRNVQPIIAYGHDEKGRETKMAYYFKSQAVLDEITSMLNANNNQRINPFASNIRTLTRATSRLMTQLRPLWNFRNMVNDYAERAVTMAFRDVVNSKGEPVATKDLMASYHKYMAKLSTQHMGEIYRFLTDYEIKTPIQRELSEAYKAGAIHLYTDVLDKFTTTNKHEKSHIERAGEFIHTKYTRLSNTSKVALKARRGVDKVYDMYFKGLAEGTQVVPALASYLAYKDNGVNRIEAGHRVRDSFDPTQAPKVLSYVSLAFPFVRSTMAGNYNTWRTITQGGASGTALGVAQMTIKLLVYMGFLGILASLAMQGLGDDEDGVPRMLKLSHAELRQGIPVMRGEGVQYLPIGHGYPSMVWGAVTGMMKLQEGTSTIAETTANLMSSFLENSTPVALASGDAFKADALKATALSATPHIFKPLTEMMVNMRSFGGAKIYVSETPQGERDSEQDSYKISSNYTYLVKELYKDTNGYVDIRPETANVLVRDLLGQGALQFIDVHLNDIADRTLGHKVTKGEEIGTLGALLGVGLGWDKSAFSAERENFKLYEHANEILKKYNVPPTDPENKGKPKGSAELVMREKLTLAGATEDEINFTINMTQWAKQRKVINQKGTEHLRDYWTLVEQGRDPTVALTQYEMNRAKLKELDELTLVENNQYDKLP